eukprot:TRINITY_DN87311_c0_g1_i1.p1 TRINITY_DN87311_c0_g1~~TRINITY_DN87311_c0_g1_i1.p1  ORF type:complete len:598 (+),score=102.22 TRINITY_DN87311_c0_g1_i1:32-1825(+)
MASAEVISGQFSPLGKSTDRGLKHLRSQVDANEVQLGKRQSQPALPRKGSGEDTNEEQRLPRVSASTLLSSRLRHGEGKPMSRVQSAPKSEFSQTMTEKWITSVMEGAGPSAKTKLSPDASLGKPGLSLPRVQTVHEWPAFTSLGKDTDVYCEGMRATHRRFVAPARHEVKPELTARSISDASIAPRTRSPDFNEKQRHRSIKPRQDISMELGDSWSSFSGGASPNTSGMNQMDMSIARPGIVEAARMNMTFAPDHYRDWSTMDTSSSTIQRLANWDLKKHSQGHKVETFAGFESEPGKYDVKYDAISPSSKSRSDFAKALPHAPASSSKGFWPAPIRLLPEKEPDPPDRSNFRGCEATRPRTGCPDMGKGMERPPLSPKKEVPYDEDDPWVTSQVWKREMTFDASSADRCIIPRHDHAPELRTCMPRANAKKGTKIVQDDLLEYWSAGGMSVTSNDFAPEKAAKDLRSWPRTDLGRSFDQVDGREQAAPIGSAKMLSSLRKPKDSAPFDFTRTMPSGFTARAQTSLSPPRFRGSSSAVTSNASPHRQRKHEALPGWDFERYDEAEARPLPGEERSPTKASKTTAATNSTRAPSHMD